MISDIKDRIRKWLTEEGLFEMETKDDNAYFNFIAKHQNITFHVLQPIARKDSVLFICSINLNLEQKQRLTKIEKTELYQKLLTTDNLFEFHPNIVELDNVRITDFIFYDGLTKDMFMKTIFRLLKTTQIVNFFIQPST